MAVVVGDAFAAFTYANEVKGSHSVEVVFFAQFVGPIENVRINPEDHATCGWFSEADLATITRPGEDPERAIIHKGFALLRGEPLTF